MSLFMVLLFLSAWINYIDRGSLSVAAPQLAAELNLSSRETGWLLSAFFWTYTLFQIPGGWLVDRSNVKRVYGAGLALWSVATALCGLASGFTSLFLLRMLLGAGQAVAFPSYNKILQQSFPEHRRGLPNAMIDVGTKAGPALGTFLAGTVSAQYGWRVMFVVLGVASLLWLIPWAFAGPAATGERQSATGPGLRAIVANRSAQATFLGLLTFNYAFYFLLTWLPSYLVKERHFSQQAMAVFGALPFAVTAAASLFCGRLSDQMIEGGRPPLAVRRGFLVTGLVAAGLALPVATSTDETLALAAVVIAFTGIGICTSNVWAFTMSLAGRASSQWTGIQNAVGNMGGVIAPAVTGEILHRTGVFFSAFAAAAFMLLLSAVIYGVWLREARPVDWECEIAGSCPR
ncbi:MAG: MFS transporter [Acidobacteria bacterium]|nr:MFS transporter [Acidobacteriota bacterium]